jgi:TRAP-type C4-dicarboxylate transport system substrate-binding protein
MTYVTKTVFAAALATFAALPASAQIKWDLASVFSPTSADGVAAQFFADRVNELSGGEIEVTVHFSGALGFDCPGHLDVVETGAVPLASICTSQLGGQDPIFLASTLPFMIETPEQARAFRDSYVEHVAAAYARHNQVVLYSYANTPAGFWSKVERPEPASLNNWKIRTFDQNSLRTMTNAGAAAVNLPWSDVIPALSTGTIDGVFTAGEAGFASGFQDCLEVFIAVNGAIGIAEGTINADVLGDLTPELRAAVLQAGADTTEFAFDRMVGLTSETYDRMRAHGMTVVENPPNALITHLKAAGAPVIEEWLAGVGETGQEILDAFEATKSGSTN